MLLANDKSDDLSRMYRLFSRLPRGLEPMAEIIKDHITEVHLYVVEIIVFVVVIDEIFFRAEDCHT